MAEHKVRYVRSSQSIDNGWSADCTCGKHVGRIWPSKYQAKQEYRDHVAAVEGVRCPVTWNPGSWPFTTRCVYRVDQPHGVHKDRADKEHDCASHPGRQHEET